MKYFLLGLTLLLCVPMISIAQDLTVPEAVEEEMEPPIRFVVGLEGGIGVHNVQGPGLRNLGVTFEVPWKKVSFGTGILIKDMGSMQYMNYTGYSYDELTDDGKITMYEYNRHKVNLKYLSIPLKVQVRLPCNCVYIQGGIEVDFLRPNNDQIFETTTFNQAPEGYEKTDIVKDVNYTFVFGVGLKLHESKRLRIFMRPEYEFMLSHIKEGTVYRKSDVMKRLKVSLGVQYGI